MWAAQSCEEHMWQGGRVMAELSRSAGSRCSVKKQRKQPMQEMRRNWKREEILMCTLLTPEVIGSGLRPLDTALAVFPRRTSFHLMCVNQFWECIWPLQKYQQFLPVQELILMMHLTIDGTCILYYKLFPQFWSTCSEETDVNPTSPTSYISLKCYAG